MTTIEHLRAARALIENGWCQHRYASNSSGHPVDVNDREAVEFCAIGACMRALEKNYVEDDVFKVLRDAGGIRCVTEWNDDDTRTKSDVLALFDKAIEMEERKV